MIDATKYPRGRVAYKDRRPLDQVDAIVLHQTACHLGERPQRWARIAAHVGITERGRVILMNPPEVVCWHANYFNRRSVGIEIGGNFRGVEANPRTLWKRGGRRTILGTAQREATMTVISWLVNTIPTIDEILSHRQTSKNRRADPGEEIWKAIALPAIWIKGFDYDPNYTKGSGLPIPKQWDPEAEGRY